MKEVRREEILDYVTYSEQREAIRAEAMKKKASRRVHLGEYLTFLFENHDTVRYQVLEMVRAEQMVKEADIRHELQTYNELLGKDGELGCTLMIEVTDPEERDRFLRDWLELPKHIYLRLEDGERIPATYDSRQVGDDRVSSVQFLKFGTGGRVPVAIGVDHPKLNVESQLTDVQREALASDLH